jgi:hypothetical protein
VRGSDSSLSKCRNLGVIVVVGGQVTCGSESSLVSLVRSTEGPIRRAVFVVNVLDCFGVWFLFDVRNDVFWNQDDEPAVESGHEFWL